MAEVLVETNPLSLPPQYYKDIIKLFLNQYANISTANSFNIKNGIVSIDVDMTDVVLFDPAFAFLLIQNPSQLLPLFEETAEECISALSSGRVANNKSTCRIRLRNLPIVPEISKNTVSDISNNTTSVIQLTGTVVRTGGIRMLELSKRFQCMKRSCQREFCVVADPEQDYVLPFPTRCPAILTGAEGKNQRCNSTDFRELPNGKQCVDYQEIKVYDKIEHISLGSIPRSITVLLLDSLVDSVSPGDDLIITGVPLRQWKPPYRNFRCGIDVVVRAIHISRASKSFVGITSNRESRIPTAMIDLKDESSPFTQFWDVSANNVYNGSDMERLRKLLVLRDQLIASVCPELYGMYVAKLSLLLTVIGGSESSNFSSNTDSKVSKDENRDLDNTAHPKEGRRRTNIHLLLAGDPGSGKSQLLRFAGELVERSVLTTGIGTTGAGLTCSAQRDSSSSSSSGASEWYLEAGALVLASGGVCCIDEFGTMKEQDRVAIHEALEQQTISVAKAGLIVKLDCKCSVVAATNLKGKFDIMADLSQNTGIAPPLLSRFDLVQVLIDRPDREWDKKVSTFLLKSHTRRHNNKNNQDSSSHETKSSSWMKQYVAHVKKCLQPRLSADAFELMNMFYRHQRQQTRNSSSVRLMESLIRVSQAHARLMYREEVVEMDAVVAIDLIARSIRSASLLDESTALQLGQEDFAEDPLEQYIQQRQRVFRMLGISKFPQYPPVPFVSFSEILGTSPNDRIADNQRMESSYEEMVSTVGPVVGSKRSGANFEAGSDAVANRDESLSNHKRPRMDSTAYLSANHSVILPPQVTTDSGSAKLSRPLSSSQQRWSSASSTSFLALLNTFNDVSDDDNDV